MPMLLLYFILQRMLPSLIDGWVLDPSVSWGYIISERLFSYIGTGDSNRNDKYLKFDVKDTNMFWI